MLSQRTILVVDDQPINRHVLCKILDSEYMVLEAENGAQALELLQRRQGDISAVLLDLVMPVMDGYTLLRRCQQEPQLADIPMLITTQNENEETEIQVLTLGAADFLTKPYKPAVICHRLANVIRLHEAATLLNNVERDALTGVYSRDFFYREAAEQMRRTPQAAYDLLCIDIEKFKLVNDLFGVAEGDSLLRHLAVVLQESLPPESICGRIGADTFTALVPHRDVYEPVIFEEIVRLLNEYPLNIALMAHFGIYVIKDTAVPVNAMSDRARLAIDSIKGKYDVFYAYYDDSLRDKMLFEQDILNSMEQALVENQFQVYYQPKYDLKTRTVVGAEALVRWVHPKNGFMMPGDFIPLFEKNGFITDLDLFVWDKVCSHIRAWLDDGYAALPVSVNVSRVDIYNERLPQLLMQMVNSYGLTPDYLHLEITETAYTENPQQLINIVINLKNLGFHIEMDDFGTGYSSLNMISELPVDTLKLDIRFLQGAGAKGNENIIRFILSLAKWMRLTVVAEGIETETQMLMLRNMDADYGQGFYFAKPLPRTDFEALLMLKAVRKQPEGQAGDTVPMSLAEDIRPQNVRRVVLAATDPQRSSFLRGLLEHTYDVIQAETTEAVLKTMEDTVSSADAVVLDCVNDSQESFSILEALYEADMPRQIPVVVLGPQDDTGEALEGRALELGAAEYLAMPDDAQVLRRRISNIITYYKLEIARDLQQKRAGMDPLTSLLNTEGFERSVKQYLADKRAPGDRSAFLLLDIDHFKELHDALGQEAGNQTLCDIAQTLRLSFRAGDIIGRVDGDTFGILAPNFGEARDLSIRMNLISRRITLAGGKHACTVNISCSIGGCICPVHGDTYDKLYTKAAQALEKAKQLENDKYQLFGSTQKSTAEAIFRNIDGLLDEATDGILVRDAQTYEILYLNESATRLTRRSKRESIGHRCYKLICDCDVPCIHCKAATEINENEDTWQRIEIPSTGVHYLLRGKRIDWDGKSAIMLWIRDEMTREMRGRIEQSALSMNLSQQQALTQKLNQTTRHLESILENLEGGIVIVKATPEGRVRPTYFSNGFCRMLRASQADLQALYETDFLQSVWPQDGWRVAQLFRAAARNREKTTEIFRLRREDGGFVWVSMNASVTEDENKDTTYYLLFTDITKEKEAAEQARRSEQDSVEKSLFLSGLSHDVRTPMNAILGITELARNEINHPETVLESLSVIEGSVGHLLAIIDAVLSATHLGGGIAARQQQYFDLRAEMSLLKTVLCPLLEQKQQTLMLDINLTHDHFYGESMRLHRLCRQLIETLSQCAAVGMTMCLYVKSSPAQTPEHMMVDIRITGGDEDMDCCKALHHLLEGNADQALDGAETETQPQILIAKAVVEAKGGALYVSDAPKPEISIQIPMQPADGVWDTAGEGQAAGRIGLKGCRFLLAEDHPINVTVMKNLLERCGAVVEAVPNGKLACDCFAQSTPGSFAAVLMDMRMPDMDGYAAAAAIRASHHPDARRVPILAVTAEAFADDERKALACGVDVYVAKPVTLDLLIYALQKAKSKRRRITGEMR